MKKYLISPKYSFLTQEDLEELPTTALPDVRIGNQFALLEKSTGSVLLLNPTIYQVLAYFQSPVDKSYVIEEVVKKTHGVYTDIKNVLNKFVNDMLDSGILVKDRRKSIKSDISNLNIGDTIGRFTIIKKFSVEGKVKTYLAEDTLLSEMVVLKVLNFEQFKRQSDRKYWTKRFQQEINILQEVRDHPSVCQLLSTFEIDNKKVAVLEFIQGSSLKKIISKNANLTFEGKKKLYANILEAYTFLHKKNIIHSDIHRNNILIFNDLNIKIIDFNISFHQPLKKGEIAIEGGVNEYLAPEKISNSYFDLVTDCADFQSEVYQLGIICYYIFYGQLPFAAPTWLSLANIIREKEPLLGQITEGADNFIKKALNKNPKQRFQSTHEMLNAWCAL